MTAPVPDRLQVLSQVPREKILVRRGKTGDRARVPLCDQSSVPDRSVAILSAGIRLRLLQPTLGVHPREPQVARLSDGQPSVIKDGASILVRVDDGLDVNEPGTAVDLDPQLPCKRTGRNLANRDGQHAPHRRDAHAF